MDVFSLITETLAGMSSLRWPVRGLGIYGCGHLLSPFLLDKKGPKNQGRHQGPTAHGDRPSPMSAGPARPTRVSVGVPSIAGFGKHVIPTLDSGAAWDLCFPKSSLATAAPRFGRGPHAQPSNALAFPYSEDYAHTPAVIAGPPPF